MKVLMVEPGKSPYAAEIESGLKSLQAAVGGDIQAVYPYEDPVALICNDEGKLMGLPLNRALFDDDGHVYDIVSGNFLIVGLGEEDFTDLSPDLMEKYGEQFKYPEKFARIAERKVHAFYGDNFRTMSAQEVTEKAIEMCIENILK